MSMTFQMLDYLDSFLIAEREASETEKADDWETADEVARDLAYEVEALRPVLESEEFADLLEKYQEKL